MKTKTAEQRQRASVVRKLWWAKNKEILNARRREQRKADPQKSRASHNAWNAKNRDKINAWARERRANDPAAERMRSWKQAGVPCTEVKYQELFATQGGCCACCHTPLAVLRGKNLVVDHCHETSKIRGLLCHNCNLGLGNFKDDPNILRAAADYIEAHL